MNFSTCAYKDNTFTFYLINQGEKVIHLTASATKHANAIAKLEDNHTCSNITDLVISDFFHALLKDLIYGGNKQQIKPDFKNNPFLDSGTDFQKRTWHLLREIGHGKVRTYKQLAEMAGVPYGARAIGNACNANPLSLIIPCHRVIGSNGLGGYAGGVEVKRVLLELEQLKEHDLPGQPC